MGSHGSTRRPAAIGRNIRNDFVSPDERTIRNRREAVVNDRTQALFGRAVSQEELLALGGVNRLPPGVEAVTTIRPTLFNRNNVMVATTLRKDGEEVGYVQITLKKEASGSPYVYLDLIEVNPSLGPNAGTQIVNNMVKEARRSGIGKIKLEAVRADGLFNGYNTWARLGFDGPAPREKYLPPNAFGSTRHPEPYRSYTRVSQYMATAEGRAYWRQFGNTYTGTFDTRPGSYSSRVLTAYIKEKTRR